MQTPKSNTNLMLNIERRQVHTNENIRVLFAVAMAALAKGPLVTSITDAVEAEVERPLEADSAGLVVVSVNEIFGVIQK